MNNFIWWKILVGLVAITLLSGTSSFVPNCPNWLFPIAQAQEQVDEWPDEYQLARAIRDHDLEAARKLIDQGVDENYLDTSYCYSRLHISVAISEEYLPMIELLLDAGALCSSQSSGAGVWYAVRETRNEDILDLILDKAQDLNQGGTKDIIALATAIKADWPYMLEALLEKSSATDPKNHSHPDRSNESSLFDVNYVNEEGYTPLLIACHEEARSEIILMLIGAGADVNFPEPAEVTEDGWLITPGPTYLGPHGYYPLHYAAKFADEEVYKALIDAGAELESQDWQKATPLFLAAKFDNEIGVRLLLEAGADPNNFRALDVYPLHFAASTVNLENVKQLVENGADVNCLNDNNWTPLHYSCMRSNNLEVIHYLIEHGADPNIANVDGLTPLQMLLDWHIEDGHTCSPNPKDCTVKPFSDNQRQIIELLQQYE